MTSRDKSSRTTSVTRQLRRHLSNTTVYLAFLAALTIVLVWGQEFTAALVSLSLLFTRLLTMIRPRSGKGG